MQARNRNQAGLTRRAVLGASVGLALTAALGASRASAQESTPASTPSAGANGIQPDGTWVFTDDRGVTVTLPDAPQRVIADVNAAAALWDFGIRPVGIFGYNVSGEQEVNAAGGNIDVTAVDFLNKPGETLDVEKAAAARPDLILSLVYAPQYGVWSIAQDVQSRVEQIAPIVTISGIIQAGESVKRFADLASALGADLNAPEIADQRASYDQATARFQQVTGEQAGVSAIFVWASAADFYVASPDAAGDVMLFRDLGLEVPTLPVEEGEYWELLSAEQALKYPTDCLFYSMRSELNSLDAFQAHPSFSQHPAVQAGQVYPWNQDFILSYGGMATTVSAIADSIAAADPNVAS